MQLKEPDFRNLTNVTLNEHCGRTHPNHKAAVPARRALTRQATSVRYIADHCPFLRIFGLQPYLKGSATWGSMRARLRKVAPKTTEGLILAFVYMAKKCGYLELIKIQSVTEIHHPRKCGRHEPAGGWDLYCKCETEDWELEVGGMEWYMREEVIEEWMRGMLDYLRHYSPPLYIEAW
jgi:hypothetical protein